MNADREPNRLPLRAGAMLLFAVAARGHVISTRRVLREAPWQIVVFSLGMYLVVYGLVLILSILWLPRGLMGLLRRGKHGGDL